MSSRYSLSSGALATAGLFRWVVIALALVSTTGRLQAGELRFRIDVLESLPGSFGSEPTAINDLGQIVGYATVGPNNGNVANQRPIIWDTPQSTPRLLWDDGFFPDFKGGRPRAINNHGVVVGQAQASPYTGVPLPGPGIEAAVGFVWDDVNGLQSLVTPLGYGPRSEALDINDSGYVVGNVGGEFGEQHGVVWSPDGFVDLIPDCQERVCNARAINESGQVAGWYENSSERQHAFRWDPRHGLETIMGPSNGESRAYAVNDSGIVFGEDFSTLESPGGPFSWSPADAFQYLTEPNGDLLDWSVRDINNRGAVLGSSDTHSILWDSQHGSRRLVDLAIGADDWTSFSGRAINNRDQIIGRGTRNDRIASFVLTPVPEPTSFTLAISAISLAIVASWLRHAGK